MVRPTPHTKTHHTMNRSSSLIIGAIMLAIGYYMQVATHIRQETKFREEVASTKGRNALVGSGVGALAGGGAAAAIGGVGVVAAGTGIGLPAGALLIALAALVGGGAGATIGAATGERVVTQVPYTVEIVEKSYPQYVSLAVIGIGSFILIWVIGGYIRERTQRHANPSA